MRASATHRSGALDPSAPEKSWQQPHWWGVRVRPDPAGGSLAYSRRHTFSIGSAAGFSETDSSPSAVELVLGALGGDLISGFSRTAFRRGVVLDALEASVSARLNNPLTALGVIGESGHPGLEEILCTLFVTSDADEHVLQAIWDESLSISPLVHTLKRASTLTLRLQLLE